MSFFWQRSSGSYPFTPTSFAQHTNLTFPSPTGVLPMGSKKRSGGGGKGAAAKGSRATRSKVDDGSVEAPASFDTGWNHLKVSPVFAAVTIRFTF